MANSRKDADSFIPGPTGSLARTFLIGLVSFSFVEPWSVNCRAQNSVLKTRHVSFDTHETLKEERGEFIK